jgi:hypothetical protein
MQFDAFEEVMMRVSDCPTVTLVEEADNVTMGGDDVPPPPPQAAAKTTAKLVRTIAAFVI